MNEHVLRFPKAVKPGAAIGVVAPSFPVRPDEKPRLIDYLIQAGYQVKLGKTVEELLNFHSYLAGDARTRAEDVNRMFADPEVDAIICARGGYGSSHTMEYLDLDVIRENPKVFIGFSDITNFHSIINKYCDLVTFHGPMLISNMLKGFDEYSKKSLEETLNMQDMVYFHNLKEDPMAVLHPGTAKGIITGGNLSLLARSVGTFYQVDTKGKILFLEDVEESIPCLDMMVTQLEQAGMMKEIRGLLLGNFSECTNECYDASYTLQQFLKDRFKDCQVPVIANVCSGHARPMGTVPMGTVCTMDTEHMEICFAKEW
ncbi:MAG: LD-carboxypeptidase [Lachnospiraceae bacterium]|nr:LD-carboxypeptidase [Lachnospiraceae bacterium]